MSAEAKLTKLKVTDLKAILQKASLPVSGVKAELVSRILASQSALIAAGLEADVGGAPIITEQKVEADLAEYDGSPTPVVQPQAITPAIPTPDPPKQPDAAGTSADAMEIAPTAAAQTDTALSTEKMSTLNLESEAPTDPELDRKRARAARFGIPIVEAKKSPLAKTTKTAPPASKGSSSKTPAPASVAPASAPKPQVLPDDAEKLKARAARFGVPVKTPQEATSSKPSSSTVATSITSTKKPTASKAAAPAAPILDPVEEERKRKRAERFGTTAAPVPPEKKLKADTS